MQAAGECPIGRYPQARYWRSCGIIAQTFLFVKSFFEFFYNSLNKRIIYSNASANNKKCTQGNPWVFWINKGEEMGGGKAAYGAEKNEGKGVP